jgi:energy-coupling factor transporter ATP-binding protein EcfA2
LIRSLEVPDDTKLGPLKNNALSALRTLQVERGVSLFGNTGAGKSTLLNTLFGSNILPTKDGVTFGNAAYSTSACVIELVRRHRPVPEYTLTINFIDCNTWYQELCMSWEQIRDIPDKDPKLSLPFSLYNSQKQSVVKTIPYPMWDTLEIDSIDKFLKSYDASLDPVAKYLSRMKEPVIINNSEEIVSEIILQLGTGHDPLSPLVASLIIEGPFPNAGNLPYDFPFFDMPGSGDPNESRKRARERAKHRAQWAIFVFGQTLGDRELEGIIEALQITPNPLLVKSVHFTDTRLRNWFFKNEQRPDLLHQVPGDEDSQQRLYRRNNPGHALTSDLQSVLTSIQEYILGLNKKYNRNFTIPQKVFLVDKVLEENDFKDSPLRFKPWKNLKIQDVDPIVNTLQEYLQNEIAQIRECTRILKEGPENSFLNSIHSITVLADGIVQSGTLPDAPSPDVYIFQIGKLKNFIQTFLTEVSTSKIFVDALKDQYYEMHLLRHHVRMRTWHAGNGICTVGGSSFNTPEKLAKKLLAVFLSCANTKEILGELKTELGNSYPNALWDLENDWVSNLENTIYCIMKPWFVANKNDAYIKANKHPKFITELLSLPQANFTNQIIQNGNLADTILARIKNTCDIRYAAQLQDHCERYPPELSGFNTELQDHQISDIRKCISAVSLLLASHEQRNSNSSFITFAEQPEVLILSPNLSFDGVNFSSLLDSCPKEAKAQVKAMSLRFSGLTNAALQTLVEFRDQFSELMLLDVSGNFNITHEGIDSLTAAFPHVTIVCRFCFITAPPHWDSFSMLSWKPTLSANNATFTGPKFAFVVGASKFANSEHLPSVIPDKNTMSQFFYDRGFTVYTLDLSSSIVWENLLQTITTIGTQFKDQNVAISFAFFGHGAQSNGTQLIVAEDENIFSMHHIYEK